MTNAITQAREDVATTLGGIEDLSVFDYLPESFVPPAAIVTPGNPYVVPGQVMGDLEVTLTVYLYVSAGTNEVTTNALDELIVNVCQALQPFGVASVGIPGPEPDYGYFRTEITITTTYRNEVTN